MIKKISIGNIQNDNTTMYLIPFKQLVEYRQNISMPPIQRLELKGKVAEIIDCQEKLFKEKRYFNFSPITIHELNNQYYLTDGQHRFKAIQQLVLNKGFRESSNNIFVNLTKVDTIEEMERDYKMMNKHTECPDFPFGIDEDIVKETTNHFMQIHPNSWKQTKRLHRPFINQTKFQESIAFLLNTLNDKRKTDLSKQNLISIIENHNAKLQNWDISNFNSKRKLSENQKKTLLNKCKNECNGLRLGMYPHTSQDYVYDWIIDIIHDQTGEKIKVRKTRKRKKTIPKVVKEKVWTNIMGNKGSGKCFVCNHTNITAFQFTCGHIIAEINGGTLDIDNLRPICSECNSRMGTRNLYEYKNEYYSHKKTFFSKLKNGITNSR